MSAIMLFSNLHATQTTNVELTEQPQEPEYEKMSFQERRNKRIKIIEGLEFNKHYPIKFIEFFILAIENKFMT
jgi:hypothetical protein